MRIGARPWLAKGRKLVFCPLRFYYNAFFGFVKRVLPSFFVKIRT